MVLRKTPIVELDMSMYYISKYGGPCQLRESGIGCSAFFILGVVITRISHDGGNWRAYSLPKEIQKMTCENSSMRWTEVKQCSRLESGDITMPIKLGPEEKEL